MYRYFVLALLLCVFNSRAASQFAGFYTGTMHLAISGNVTMPERPIGPMAITIDAAGNVSSSGDLSGTVNDAGVVTWVLPNTGNFASGQITDNVLRSTGTLDQNGTISTYRIEVRSQAPTLDGASPLAGRLERVNPSTAVTEMIRVRFLNGQFVAVGRHGAMAFSADGITWTFSGLNTNADLIDVAYGNGTYLVLGFGGVTYTSPDAVTWTRQAPGGGVFSSSIAFGNGIFMMNSSGTLKTSTDGIAWQAATVSLPAVAYGGVEFVGGNFVFDSGGVVGITADGATMIASGNAGVGNIMTDQRVRQHAAFGNGVYVVGGATGVAYSANGSNWTLGTGPTARIDAVIFANGKFALVDAAKTAWTSVNGAAWERVGFASQGVRSIAFGAGVFVAAGSELYTSADGNTWVRPEVDATRPNLTAVNAERTQQNPARYYFHDQYSSVDPLNGPTSPAPVRGALLDLSQVGRLWFGDNGYVYYALGTWANGSGVAPRLTDRTLRAAVPANTSSYVGGDGGVMIRVTYPVSLQAPVFALHNSPTTSDLLSGTFGGVMVGANGTILKLAPNETTWNVVSSGTTATLRHVFNYIGDGGPDMFIAVGDNGTILTSPDGTAWTRRESGTTERLVGSTFGYFESPKKFFIASEDGLLLESTTGTTWTRSPRRLPTSKKLNSFVFARPTVMMGGGDNGEVMTDRGGGVFSAETTGEATFRDAALGNGRWVLVGDGLASASFDGRTWATRRNAQYFQSVAFGGGRFVAVGPEVLATSGDGLTWNVVRYPNKFFTGVTYGGGKFVAVGGATIFVSADGQTWTDKTRAGAALTVVTYGNGRFVATGGNSSATSSDGGETWTSTGGVLNQTGIAFGNGRFVSVGTEGRVGWSENGSTWNIRQLQGPTVLDNRPFFTAIEFVNGEFMATTQIGVIYRSADGATWTHLYPGLAIDPEVMAFGNGRLLLAQNSEIYFVNMPDNGAPAVASNPAPADLLEGGTLTLSGSFTGANVELVWLLNGQPLANDARISGANTGTLRIEGLTAADAGAYALAANNASGSRVSAAANVTVTARPRITTQPQSITLAAGGDTTLTAVAVGSGLSFQWFRNGTAIDGQITGSLDIRGATAAAAGIYHVEVRNIAGMVRSDPAGVSVRSAPAGLSLDAFTAAVTFVNPATSSFQTIGVAPDGKIYLSGYFQVANPNGGVYDGIIRLNADGTVDGTFNPPTPDSQIEVFHFLPNGQILIAGGFAKINNLAAPGLARLNADGSRDMTFASGIAPNYSGIYSMKARADGKILVGGDFTTFGGSTTIRRLGLLNADGSPDTTFVPSALQNQVLSLDTQSDGRIVMAGYFTSPGTRITRFDAAGQWDSTFNTGASGITASGQYTFPIPYQVSVVAGDKFYLGGRFGTYNGQAAVGLIRVNANGSLDTSFNAGISAVETPTPASIISVIPMGDNVLFGGSFQAVRGDTTKKHLAMVDSTGQLSAGLNIGTGLNNTVNKLARGLNGSVFVAGNFSTINGLPRVKLAKLSAAGGESLPLVVTAPTQPVTVAVGGTAAISVAATGHGALSFQWRKGAEVLSGQTSATLWLENVQEAAEGAYTVVVTDANGSASADVQLVVGEEQPTGYAAYAASLPEGQRGENDDADGDRLSNIAEYAMGTSATVADAAQRPAAASVSVEGQTYAAVRFTRNRNATGVAIEVTASDTVTFSVPAATVETVEDLGGGMERVTVRSTQPLPSLPRFFLRVNARQN